MINDSIKYQNKWEFISKKGKCDWCEKHNQNINLITDVVDGTLWTIWLCDSCMNIKKCESFNTCLRNSDCWRKNDE